MKYYEIRMDAFASSLVTREDLTISALYVDFGQDDDSDDLGASGPCLSPELLVKAERAARFFVPLAPDTEDDPDYGF